MGMNILRRLWQKYCDFLDNNGLSPESQRCCVPLDERAQQAIAQGETGPVEQTQRQNRDD